jgi:hypothetical protein
MISKLERIWGEVVLAQSRNYPYTYFEELRKTRKNLSKDIRCSGRDSKRTPPECAWKALPPEPTCVETPWSLVHTNVSEDFSASFFKLFEYRFLVNVGKYVQNYKASSQETVVFIVTSVRTINPALSLRYKAQPVNIVSGNSRCLLWEPYGTQIHSVGRMQTLNVLKQVVHIVTNAL